MQVEFYNTKSHVSETKHISQALLILLSKGLPLEDLPKAKALILAGDKFQFRNTYSINLLTKR